MGAPKPKSGDQKCMVFERIVRTKQERKSSKKIMHNIQKGQLIQSLAA
jgi:hypothetical protein